MKVKKSRVFYLDFLRAISILLIIIYHFNQQLGFHEINAPEIFIQNFKNDSIGSLGITLFIMLSGASLMLNYREKISLKKYFYKRFVSIYPLFWLGYIFTYFGLFIINTNLHHEVEPWKLILTLIGFDGFLYYKIPNFYLVGEWFLGLIVIMYILFPILRYLVLKMPILTCISILAIYIVVVQNYSSLFEIDVIRNPLTRLPEFVFGMLFIQYADKIKQYLLVIPAIITGVFLFAVTVSIPHIHITFILGASLFIIFAYLSHFIKNKELRSLIGFVSKFSFAAFIVHHNIIGQFFVRFDRGTLSIVETYALFIIVLSLIFIAAVYLSKVTHRVVSSMKRIWHEQTMVQ
ncbi:acyltransferase family protein [Paenibacillus lentus]|uniref:acyltransferase family protein n=1 Tax=Paenibacillus lentus TaxID=1338368 RepID=UPI0013DE4B61|nr:acyltransferase [Paenibacillus lentus]